MRRWIGAAAALLVVAGTVVGLTAGGHDAVDGGAKSTSGGAGAPVDRTDTAPGVAPAGGGKSAAVGAEGVPAPAPETGGTPVPGVQPKIARTAELHVGVRRNAIAARLRDAETFVTDNGGYVVRSESGRDFGTLTVRVPADRYDEALHRFAAMGTVTSSTTSGVDRTGESVDREARLRNLRAQEATLQDIMRQARTVPDTIAVQQQLAAVQEQVEQLVGQQQLLDGETTFATITASFTPTGAPPARSGDEPSSLGRAWTDAVDALVTVAGGMIVVAGAMLPFALLAGLGVLGWRARRRRPRLGGARTV